MPQSRPRSAPVHEIWITRGKLTNANARIPMPCLRLSRRATRRRWADGRRAGQSRSGIGGTCARRPRGDRRQRQHRPVRRGTTIYDHGAAKAEVPIEEEATTAACSDGSAGRKAYAAGSSARPQAGSRLMVDAFKRNVRTASRARGSRRSARRADAARDRPHRPVRFPSRRGSHQDRRRSGRKSARTLDDIVAALA